MKTLKGHGGVRIPEVSQNLPALLLALEAAVAGDVAPPLFGGRLSVGVRDPDGTVWWCAEFAHRASTVFSTAPLRDGDDELLLDAAAAAELLRTGVVPQERSAWSLRGSGGVMSAFAKRYLTKTDWIGVRQGGLR